MAASASAIGEKVHGLREANAAFQALPEVTRDRLNEATFTTLSETKRHAQARLSSSPSVDTRSLLNSIAFTLNEKNGRGRVGITAGSTVITVGSKTVRVKGIIRAGAGGSASTKSGAKRIVPTKYGPKVEFGTRFMKAEPFMFPAVESQKAPYLERCKARGTAIERDLAAIGNRTL